MDSAPKAQPARKRQPAAIPDAAMQVTAPAIDADVSFANVVNAERDSAMLQEQALRAMILALDAQYERDRERLDSAWHAGRESVVKQINQQARIIEASDAAIEALKGGNVVPMRSAVEQAA